MTAPVEIPVGPTAQQLAVELQAAARITAPLRAQLQQAARQITTLYLRFTGDLTKQIPGPLRQAFADAAAQIIQRVDVDIRADLWAMVLAALRAGQLSAQPFLTAEQQITDLAAFYRDQVYALSRESVERPSTTAEWVVAMVAAMQARVAAGILASQAAPTVGVPPADYPAAMGLLNQAQAVLVGLDRDVRWATNAAFNQGVRDMADQSGMARMWIAERDACLHCLAYSGEIAGPGQPYRTGLTFYIDPNGNPKPLKPFPAGFVWGPPLHPNCRCFQRPAPVLQGYPVMPWETEPYSPSQALKREARRSVLRGTSGSDSMPARLRATSALIAAGSGLPKSVVARARAAVRAGQYR